MNLLKRSSSRTAVDKEAPATRAAADQIAELAAESTWLTGRVQPGNWRLVRVDHHTRGSEDGFGLSSTLIIELERPS